MPKKHQELWDSLTKLTFEEVCNNLDQLKVDYDRNNPKDYLVDTLRRFLLNDIN